MSSETAFWRPGTRTWWFLAAVVVGLRERHSTRGRLSQGLICLPAFFLRLLLPYERHLKGEQDKPLPLPKPRKQEGVQDRAPGARVKAVGAKKLKNAAKSETQDDRAEAAKDPEPSQVSGA